MSKKITLVEKIELLKNLERWSLYKKEMCATCEGLCCSMPVEVSILDLVRMGALLEFFLESPEKKQIKEALKHPGILRYTPSSRKYTLAQKPDQTCYFLDSNKRCTIYENRPDTCRQHPQIGPRPGFCAYFKKDQFSIL